MLISGTLTTQSKTPFDIDLIVKELFMPILPQPLPSSGTPSFNSEDREKIARERHILSQTKNDISGCTRVAEVGIFFDGTNNNRGRDLPKHGHSNIVRLFNAYPDKKYNYKYPFYIPGVGTRCDEVGETDPESFRVKTLGRGLANGGWRRIVLGCVHVLNAMHDALTKKNLIDPRAIAQKVNSHEPNLWSSSALRPVIQDQFKTELQQLRSHIEHNPRPGLRLLSISIFGFSRGAAQARAFANVLGSLFDKPGSCTIAGVPVEIRFMGLFDTVASVGLLLNALNIEAVHQVGGQSLVDGRYLWATPELLARPPWARHVVHLVAAHEQRRSFPLDLMPGADIEHVYPGMHSDVGGGYNPGEEGRSTNKNALDMLARIPCMDMYKHALLAGVPLYEFSQMADKPYCPVDFAPIPSHLLQTYHRYLELSRKDAAAMAGNVYAHLREQCARYLRWRGSIQNRYHHQPFYGRAPRQDRQDLWDANEHLKHELVGANDVRETAGPEAMATAHAVFQGMPPGAELDVCGPLFDGYVHDSYAGFMVLTDDRSDIQKGLDNARKRYEARHLRIQKTYQGSRQIPPTLKPPPDTPDSDASHWLVPRREPMGGYLHWRTVYPPSAAEQAQYERDNEALERQAAQRRQWDREAEEFRRMRP